MVQELVVKNPPAMQEMRVRSLGREDPPKKGTATHSSILAWRIPWQRSLVGYSRGVRVAKNQALLKQLSTHQQLGLSLLRAQVRGTKTL